MSDANSVKVGVTHDCGAKFEVPVGGLELENVSFSCPQCGGEEKFTTDQIAGIVAEHKAIAKAARDAIRKAARGK